MRIRKAAVAGTWYPGTAGALIRDVEDYVNAAKVDLQGHVQGIIAPHAGLMFSGRIGASAYKAAAASQYDVLFVVGPSHYVGFDGFSVWPEGAFDTPLGPARIDSEAAKLLLRSPFGTDRPDAHMREHSLELQLPFVCHLFSDIPIVPVVIGFQTREVIHGLAVALADAARYRRALLIASTDLSHFLDARTAASLDGRVQGYVEAFDPDGLLDWFEQHPPEERGRYVACGGGAAIAVMLAARQLGTRHGRVLSYGHSGEISGDHEAVVGYLAAALGTFGRVQ